MFVDASSSHSVKIKHGHFYKARLKNFTQFTQTGHYMLHTFRYLTTHYIQSWPFSVYI